eukprot:COSAG04_NODE_2669_length_3757_cov_4.647348_4_plen_97_part_00
MRGEHHTDANASGLVVGGGVVYLGGVECGGLRGEARYLRRQTQPNRHEAHVWDNRVFMAPRRGQDAVMCLRAPREGCWLWVWGWAFVAWFGVCVLG